MYMYYFEQCFCNKLNQINVLHLKMPMHCIVLCTRNCTSLNNVYVGGGEHIETIKDRVMLLFCILL